MAKGSGGPVVVPLYGVPIRAVIESGDPDLMKAMLQVSDYLIGQSQNGMADWKTAHQELEKATR